MNSKPFPWYALGWVVVLTLILSVFSATKKFAFWIGGLALLAIIIPPWRKAGYPTGFPK